MTALPSNTVAMNSGCILYACSGSLDSLAQSKISRLSAGRVTDFTSVSGVIQRRLWAKGFVTVEFGVQQLTPMIIEGMYDVTGCLRSGATLHE